MKNSLKILGFILLIIVFGLVIILLMYNHERNKTFRNDVAHCVIYLDGEIEDLNRIEFEICDSTYKYTITELKDTINENLAISDKSFPCPVNFTYYFNSGKKKTMPADSFNTEGYSGANIYMIKKNTIKYKYNS